VFEPDQYTGKKNQLVIPGEKIDPKATSTVTVEKTGKGYLFACNCLAKYLKKIGHSIEISGQIASVDPM
jgi:hypothetical protein